jgi:hypothetical protein
MSLGSALKRGFGVAGRVLAVLLLLALVGGGLAIWYFRTREAPPTPPTGDVAMPRGTRAIELWFPDPQGQKLVLESREVVEDALEGDALVRTVVSELLRGPEGDRARAAFPGAVTLEHVYRDPGGGLYLDFSNTLRSGFHGGSTAEYLLVTSLLRTLSANAPEVSRVTVTAGGQPLTTLGGHIRLDGPLLVADWR